MASVSLSLQQTTSAASIPNAAQYTVTNQITSSIGIDPGVFVYSLASGSFSHYATAADMSLYPDGAPAAAAAGVRFYRCPTLTRVWATINQMQEDLLMTQIRLQRLLNEISQLQTSLIVNQTVNLSAGC